MSFKHIADKYKRTTTGLPDRALTMLVRHKILDGSFYDVLRYQFFQERGPGDRPILLAERAPNVRMGTNTIINAVEDQDFMLFGEGQFPGIDTPDPDTKQIIEALIDETDLAAVMREAAFGGSCGSAAVRIHLSKTGRIHFKYFDTTYLTPTWDDDDPDVLVKVEERRRVLGLTLAAAGYAIPKDNLRSWYWFLRVWDAQAETWYVPWLVDSDTEDKPHDPVPDEDRTVLHRLGFVPMVWIRNLHGGDDVDGGCQWSTVVDDCIQIDYLMSQLGRSLKYQADPFLLIKEPPVETIMNPTNGLAEVDLKGDETAQLAAAGDLYKGPNSMLTVNSMDGGGAEWLELKGTSAQATTDYCKTLKSAANETIHGNRIDPEKIGAGPRGSKALEMVNNGLVMLADQLRASYGEKGLKQLIAMFVRIVALRPGTVKVKGEVVPTTVGATPLSDLHLNWAHWYSPTPQDLLTQAQGLVAQIKAGFMSRERALKIIASDYDIDDIQAELVLIKEETASEDARRIAFEEAGKTGVVTGADGL